MGLFHPDTIRFSVNKFVELNSVDDEAWDVHQTHHYHKPDDAVRESCCQVSQWNKENGCHCGKDELQSQFPYTINKITVTHTIYQYENICCHHNAHADVNGNTVAYPYRIDPR